MIWSTGFIVADAVAPHASPGAFLAVRFALTALLILIAALLTSTRWPRGRNLPHHLIAGALLQGGYLAGGYTAVAMGMPAATMALIGATQPALSALFATLFFSDHPTWRGWLGIALATAGTVMILGAPTADLSLTALGAAAAAVTCATIGGLAQRGAVSRDPILTTAAVQNAGALIVALILVLIEGPPRWTGDRVLLGALAWSVLGLSGIAATLLVFLVRRDGAPRATSLILLAPPLAALQGSMLFGDVFGGMQAAAMAIALTGVWLTRLD